MTAPQSTAPATPEIIIYNPATGEELGRVPSAGPSEVEDTLVRSRTAFAQWRRTDFATRRKLITRAREVILAELDAIAELISAETGKPVAEAISSEIAPVLDLMQYFARNAERLLKPRKIGIGLFGLAGRSSKIVYHPLGVVGIIPAWNYPFTIPLGEAAMALMAGNAVIIKPSELTPLVGLKIGEIFENAGAPGGLVSIVTGAGETGAALVEAGPDKIMFTGSIGTGKKILRAAAEKMTPVVLELGGKDPMIVLDDADLEIAAGGAVWAAFCNLGQTCASVERVYVHDSIADRFTKLVIEKTEELKQGIGTAHDISLGSMSSPQQLATVERHVKEFRDSGAAIETGGRINPKLGGLFYEPTVITGASNEMTPMREETFGPTLPIATFSSDEEAVRLANDSEFGLTASVWTRDIARGRRIAEQIEAGSVAVNDVLYTHGIGQTPWGGFKSSGRGRTHGREGLMELVQAQHIHVNRFAILPDPWWFPYSETATETFRGFATNFASGSIVKAAGLMPRLLRRLREMTRSRK
jgi:acyl-CoA reductase-like NAD-dependent aldehyde dehydrogenase